MHKDKGKPTPSGHLKYCNIWYSRVWLTFKFSRRGLIGPDELLHQQIIDRIQSTLISCLIDNTCDKEVLGYL